MDNISFHKTDKIKNLLESVGCSILYLPPYSPDLNDIEHWWFKIKNAIRNSAYLYKNFADCVSHILSIA